MSPRVTLGVATYERDTYLEEAVASCLNQTYEDLEVLVVLDGGRNPKIEEVLARLHDPRLRIVRHEVNRGIAEAYNTIVREAHGELIAMLGDDDRCEPDRIARQVEVFDRHPDTGVAHGAATIIDGAGAQRGIWPSRDRSPHELLRHLVREHNTLVDPTRMVHRRVYEAVGGYDKAFRLAQDFDFWLRAVRHFRFRDVPGGPLIGFRRHGENFSDESAQALGRDGLGHDHRLREAAVDGVLDRRPLVVEHRRAGDPQQPRGDGDVVGAVPEGEVEGPVAAAPARQGRRAIDEAECLGRQPPAAMAPDDLVLDAEALAQLDGLREVARGDADLRAAGAQRVDDRPQHKDVRAVGEVNPGPHRARRRRPRRPGRASALPRSGGRGACGRARR